MQRKALIILVVLLVFVAFTPDIFAQGCSQCRLVPQTNAANGGTIGASLNPAILYLMAVPYVILFLVFRKKIVTLYKALRNKKTA